MTGWGDRPLAGRPGARAERLEQGLRIALWALGGYYLALFLYLAVQHIAWPFELEWMEGGMVDSVRRLLQGQALYAPPALDFTAFSYGPLYFYAAAVPGVLFGANFALLRALSVLSCLAALLLLNRWVREESGSRQAGLLAAALFLACYPVSGAWYDLARVDSLFLLLLLGGLYLVRRGRSTRSEVAAALLLALAAFCKQTALVITLPVLCWHLLGARGLRRWRWPALYLILLAGGYALMQGLTGGWFAWYTFYLPRQHPPVWWRIHHFWIDYFFKPLPIATLLGALALLGGRHAPGRQDSFWLFFAAGLVGGPWLAVVPSGAYHNAVIPGHAALAVLCGLAFARPGRWRLGWMGLAVVQLLLLFYLPGRFLPPPADRAAGEELVRQLAAAPGPVWIPGQGYLAEMAGKGGSAHRCALDDVLRGKDEAGKRILLAGMNTALREGRFAVVVTGEEGLPDSLAGAYQSGRKLFADPGRFRPMTGWQARPEWWYARRTE